jgi:signal transduction histidine kinase
MNAAIGLAWRVLLVGLVCYASTEVGFANKFPPHNISALWPTGAILLGVLVVVPMRHWWAYTLAAYFTSVIKGGFSLPAFLFLIAALVECFIAAVGVRRFAGGLRAFDSRRNLAAYFAFAVVLAPAVAALVGAFAGVGGRYWFYWRVWFLSEAVACLTLAPAILSSIAAARTIRWASPGQIVEAFLIGAGCFAVSFRVFSRPMAGHAIPALVYLPLPLLLWAAMRFGPVGANLCLLMVAFLSISGAVQGHGPFAGAEAGDNVVSLQLFLIAVSVPVMVLATAITERRAAEHETERQRGELAHVTRLSTLGELGTSLAHELNQPLTAMLSNVQAARRFLSADSPDVREVREILEDVVQDNHRATEVIARLRALVRKETPHFLPLDAGDVVRDVLPLVHSDAILRNSRVSVDVAPGLPPVRGDRIQLQQVVLNLLLNAFEAMKDRPAHEREVVVRVDRDGAEMVRIAVRDRGTGLSADAAGKIFQPFYTTKPNGLGMGLSISRSIIEGHAGRLQAENNTDRGATFSFTLPVAAGS